MRFIKIMTFALVLLAMQTVQAVANNKMTFVVDNVTASTTDEYVTVPIRATVNEGFGSGILYVRWDKTKLSLTNVKYADFTRDNGSRPVDQSNVDGFHPIMFGDGLAFTDNTNTGEIFTLTFKINQGVQPGKIDVELYKSDIQDSSFELNDIDATFINGGVTLTAPNTPVTPSTGVNHKMTFEVDNVEASTTDEYICYSAHQSHSQ